jgi:hypothetical protein
VAKALGINRKTVARYRAWAQEQRLLEESLPSLSELKNLVEEAMDSSPPPQNTSSVEPYREVVVKLRQEGVEIAAIHQRLKERGSPVVTRRSTVLCATWSRVRQM